LSKDFSGSKRAAGFLIGLAVDTNVGDGVAPLDGGGVEGRKGRDFQSVKEVLFDVADAVFDPALFVAFANIAGRGLEAIMSGKSK